MALTVLVGAEGCAEIQGEAWVRPSTEDEKKALLESVMKQLPVGKTVAHLLVDETGRPYFFLTVDEATAPAEAVEKARKYKRVRRLVE